VKKVAVTIVFFFNTKLQPSLLCYKGKRNKTKEEEGDDNCHRLLHEAALQRSFKRGRRRQRERCSRRLFCCVVL
jgi:hypothetical protein